MTSIGVILAVAQGKYSPNVLLEEVFDKIFVSLQIINKKTLEVKVIKQLNAKEFLVADSTGIGKIQITSGFINGKRNLHENNYVNIKFAKVDYEAKKIFLCEDTEVIPMAKEFPVDEIKPANVCIIICFT